MQPAVLIITNSANQPFFFYHSWTGWKCLRYAPQFFFYCQAQNTAIPNQASAIVSGDVLKPFRIGAEITACTYPAFEL